MRVATRRLRSTLTSFDQVLSAADELGAELKWLGGVLGTARDAEVMAARLQAGLEGMPRDLADRPGRWPWSRPTSRRSRPGPARRY